MGGGWYFMDMLVLILSPEMDSIGNTGKEKILSRGGGGVGLVADARVCACVLYWVVVSTKLYSPVGRERTWNPMDVCILLIPASRTTTHVVGERRAEACVIFIHTKKET